MRLSEGLNTNPQQTTEQKVAELEAYIRYMTERYNALCYRVEELEEKLEQREV